jgi:hypothetical protein
MNHAITAATAPMVDPPTTAGRARRAAGATGGDETGCVAVLTTARS